MAAIKTSAQGTLRIGEAEEIGWASFDPAWYLTAYPEVCGELAGASAEAILRFYLEQGQVLGHSPNDYFAEAWHRQRYPRVAEAVAKGRFASAFDAYCRHGLHGYSPHWLFDEFLYRMRYPDITEDYLLSNGFANGYDQFLRQGQFDGRSGHPLFDPEIYGAELEVQEQREAKAQGHFTHYIRSLRSQSVERRTSVVFDPTFYLAQLQQSGTPLAQTEWLSTLHHYLCNTTPIAFDPLPEFSERYYLGRYPEVTNAIRAGKYRNGYEHFLLEGRAKLLSPHRSIDLAYYASRENVTRDLETGKAHDAFEHYLTYGRIAGLPTAPSEDDWINEEAAQLLLRLKASNLLPLAGRRPLDFSCRDEVELSVVVVLHNQFALTMLALGSLRANFSGNMQLILVDSGSTDETRSIGQYVTGADVLRFADNVGFVRGCNAGLPFATGEFVLFLNNDMELAPGALRAALQRLRSQTRVGAVGGKIIRSHGLLQEAGCMIWSDGSASGYLRDASPLAPEANFVRTVDYCSAAFLMVRRDIVTELDGFDDAFAPAYYEDTDLCVRIAQLGSEVVYDPSIVVLHHEYGSSAGDGDASMQIARNRQVFAAKHEAYLKGRPNRDSCSLCLSRFADPAHARRILFIEDTIPLRSIGSGFVRSNDIIQVMATLGCQVTVFPLKNSRFDIAAIYRDMPETVEVMHDSDVTGLGDFLAERAGYFDVLWVARAHNLDRISFLLDPVLAGASKPAIILDTEAVSSRRDVARTAFVGAQPLDLDAALAEEFRHAGLCRGIVAVSDGDAEVLRQLGFDNVAIVGHMRALHPTPRSFAARAGLLFVGAIHQRSSPNLDSLEWFVEEVLPIIERALGWETRLTVAGYIAPEISLQRFARHSRVTLAGPVDDLPPLYDQHRVFVAPTRFAAGLPYKIYEAASYGLPVAATELLRGQMGWENGQDLLAAATDDPAAMAEQILALYRDETLWQRIRANALERLRRENGAESYAVAIRRVLDAATGSDAG